MKKCLVCDAPLTKKQLRDSKGKGKFCSHSCSARYTNTVRSGKQYSKEIVERLCPVCKKPLRSKGAKKFCSLSCCTIYNMRQRQLNYIKRWKENKETGYRSRTFSLSNSLRAYLYEKVNYACELCGFKKIHPYTGNPVLRVHHIDGNSSNNKEENLQVLCPNCHEMTYNYGARNKNCQRPKRVTVYK